MLAAWPVRSDGRRAGTTRVRSAAGREAADQPSGPGSLGVQDLAAVVPVGLFDKLLAYSSIIGCVAWEWKFSEVSAYLLHAVCKVFEKWNLLVSPSRLD